MTTTDPTMLTTLSDGLTRCSWTADADENSLRYHDKEWGIETHDPRYIFETLSLCGFAAGIRWGHIYRKRDGFRRAFRNFELTDVAAMNETDIDALMEDASIIRNRRKIGSTVNNARAALKLDKPLHELVWDFAPKSQSSPRSTADFKATTPEAKALAKTLKTSGFTWVGPNSIYAFMQTIGIVNDHIAGCFLAKDK